MGRAHGTPLARTSTLLREGFYHNTSLDGPPRLPPLPKHKPANSEIPASNNTQSPTVCPCCHHGAILPLSLLRSPDHNPIATGSCDRRRRRHRARGSRRRNRSRKRSKNVSAARSCRRGRVALHRRRGDALVGVAVAGAVELEPAEEIDGVDAAAGFRLVGGPRRTSPPVLPIGRWSRESGHLFSQL